MKSERIKNLEQKILNHKKLYYLGKPEVSDFEYDAIEEELASLNPDSFVLTMVGSDSFNTGKVPHATKMLSLSKSYSLDELLKWKGEEDLLSTFKIDGSSCSLIYEKGELVLAKTRGDGRFGENITEKALYLSSIPKRIETNLSFEVRGEIFCSEVDFISLAKEMESRSLDVPSSQRNIVAGIIGRRENVDLAKLLRFQAFELITPEVFGHESEKLLKLSQFGFVTPDFSVHKNKKSVEKSLDEAQSFISEGDYLIDGLVFTYNKISLHQELGETSHHPRYKMAYKFKGESKQTEIESITWQVSRNGFLTPVANVKSVELSGANVSRVTLHNFGMVNQFKLKAGDLIEIVRSGEVIPKFLSVIESSKEEFSVPRVCPSCQEEVVEKEIRLVCLNNHCPDKIKDEILNFIKKIGIDDLSSKRLEALIAKNHIQDIASLYQLTEEKLFTVDKVKEKLAKKIIKNIEESKNVDFVAFLSALGLRGGAYNKCEKIVINGFDTIEKILNLEISDLEAVESFAELSAKNFIESIQEKKELIKKLISYNFDFKLPPVGNKSGPLEGVKFCITGTLSMKRSELQKLVKQNGGLVQTGVTKDTSYLLTNDTESTSSKFKKAMKLKVPLMSEKEFLKTIGL